MTNIYDTLMQELRAQDGDLYLSHLFVTTKVRAHVLTLYKAYSDISSIPFDVSEPMLGHIRLQWWREMLNNPSKNANDGVPIACALQALQLEHGNEALYFDPLQNIVDGRDKALADEMSAKEEAAIAGDAFMHMSCLAVGVSCNPEILKTAGTGFDLMRLAAGDEDHIRDAGNLLNDAARRFNALSRRERVSLIPVFMPIGLARRQAKAYPNRKSLLFYQFSLLKMAVTAKI